MPNKNQNDYHVINDYHIIEKSKGLIQLDQYAEFGEAQYILLDIYLSQINPRDKGTQIVKFPKKDYEKYKNVNRVRNEALDKEMQRLMIAVKIPDPKDEKSFRIKPLFKECSCQKEKDGSYWITMICEEEMNDLFFDVSKIGYIKYRLGMMRSLKLPARLLYNELHAYKYMRPYSVPLDKLKDIMKLNTKAYQQNNAFNRELKKCVNEINENTNLMVSYTTVKNGNHEIVSVNFIINIDTAQIDEDLAMYIAHLMDISYDKAVPIAKEVHKNNIDDDEMVERIEYVKNKSGVKNRIGYTISIMKNNELWNKIKESEKEKKNDEIIESEEGNSDKLKELADYHLRNVK